MLNGALARRYAQALFEIVPDSLDQTETELRELVELIRDNKEVAHILYYPHISLSDKKSTLDKLILNQFSEVVRRFIFLLIDRRRQMLLPLVLREFTKFADEARNIIEAKVETVTSLTSEQKKQLTKTLGRMTGKNIRLINHIQPELIGGVRVQVGDRVIDGSVAFALQKMRGELRKTSDKEPQEIGVK